MSNFKPRIIFTIDYRDSTTETVLALNDFSNLSLSEKQYEEIICSIQDVLQEKLKVFVKTDELLD